MPSPARFIRVIAGLAWLASAGTAGTFFVPAGAPGAWPLILASAGHAPSTQASADIYVAPLNAPASPDWRARVMSGAAVILEGSSPLASSFGFTPGSNTIPAIHVV